MSDICSLPTVSPGGYSEWEPPDPIPNSEVKLLSADDSVGFPHVKVGHRQVLIPEAPIAQVIGVFFFRRVPSPVVAAGRRQ